MGGRELGWGLFKFLRRGVWVGGTVRVFFSNLDLKYGSVEMVVECKGWSWVGLVVWGMYRSFSGGFF